MAQKPRFAIIGAGATGGFLGVRLACAGYAVTLIARGAQLEAIQRAGLVIECPDGSTISARPEATDRIEAVSDADVVFLTTKAHSIGSIAERLGHALPTDATLVTAQNGIPWWYFHRHGGALDGAQVQTVGPGGESARPIHPHPHRGRNGDPSTGALRPGAGT